MASTVPESRLALWVLACRPKTLWAGFAPVVIGCALAIKDDVFVWWVGCVCMTMAISVQIGANFANDYFDFVNGADTDERIGPLRVTQAGLISPSAMRRGFIVALMFSAMVGGLMFGRGGWPVAVITVLSVSCAVLYTGGPFPLGYHGLGECFAFAFFGPVAVGGTYYLHALVLTMPVVIASVAPGLFAVAMITVNNLRDIDGDRKAGKRTLAVRFGHRFAQWEFVLSVALACMVPVYLYLAYSTHYATLIAAVVGVVAFPAIRVVLGKRDGPALNWALGNTGKLLLIYSVVFSVGWLW